MSKPGLIETKAPGEKAMTATEYSLAKLEEILSALDGQRRNPCTKKAAVKAINRKAEEIGLSTEDVFDAAEGLISGRMSAEEWRESMIAKAPAEAEVQADAEAQIETEEPEEPAQDDDPVDVRSEEFAETEAAQANEASWSLGRKTRQDSKQARMIEMMRRPEGATITQIAEEMGWQRHTVRGAIAGALRKKLGLTITSGKIDGQHTYRIEG